MIRPAKRRASAAAFASCLVGLACQPSVPSPGAPIPSPVATSTPLWAAPTAPAMPSPPSVTATPAPTSTVPPTQTAATPTPRAAELTASSTPEVSPTPTITSTAAYLTPTPTFDPCSHIEAFDYEPPEPFDLLGIVEVQRKNPADRTQSLIASAKQAACRMGGDAVVILYKAKRREGGVAPRPQAGLLPKTDLRAAVIRYRR